MGRGGGGCWGRWVVASCDVLRNSRASGGRRRLSIQGVPPRVAWLPPRSLNPPKRPGLALPDPFDEAAIVAKVLVCVFNRELAHRIIERRIGAHVAGDPRWVAGSRVGSRERPGAEFAKFLQSREIPIFRDR